jgi:subtilisin family serine protease
MSVRPTAILLIGAALFLTAPASRGGEPALDPAVRALLAGGQLSSTQPLNASDSSVPRSFLGPAGIDAGSYQIFLESPGGGIPPADGLSIYPLGDGRYAAQADLAALRRLAGDDRVTSIRLSRPVSLTLDRSGAFLGLPRVRRVDPETGVFRGATGAGVVVGVVDSGVDWTHPDFLRPDGTTRLFRYWDQIGFGPGAPPDYGFGVEYTDRLIDYGIINAIDFVGHGTHVMGIAAGNGRASFVPGQGILYGGMAPEATLIAVRTNFTEVGVVLGARYVMERADLLGMPAVVNLSLGNHFGPHRGTTPFESALAGLTGPGKLIVCAAGNDAADGIHAEVTVGPGAGAPAPLELQVPPYDKTTRPLPYAGLEGWFDKRDRFRFTVENPQGDVVTVFESGDQQRRVDDVRGTVLGWYVEDLGMATLFLEIDDNPGSVRGATGTWRVRIEPLDVAGDPRVDFWMVGGYGFRDGATPRFLSHVDPRETIISPATSPGLLAVGAMATRDCWLDAQGESTCYASPPPLEQAAYFSSLGPTPDGRNKPDILAPGFGVVSARSSTISPEYATADQLSRLSTPNGRYYVSQGTSMAAPHVSGGAALLLARFPHLTMEGLRHRLTARAGLVADPRTGDVVPALDIAGALARPASISLASAIPDGGGIRVSWYAGKIKEPVRFRIYKGFSDAGTFVRLDAGLPPDRSRYEILDRSPETGRTQVYRITAVDAAGLEEDLDTLRVDVPGTPVFVFRAPDPNPAKDRVAFRFFLPPSPSGGSCSIAVIDSQGRRVASPGGGGAFPAEGGERLAEWDLRGPTGRRVAGGIYFVRIAAAFTGGETRSEVRRVAVLP